MINLKEYKLDLGIKQLLPTWKKLLSKRYFSDDLVAGITVAFIAIPLSLAVALASNVPPEAGLITAIIAGIVVALFGGSNLSVSGPSAAMSVLIADIVEKFGFESLILVCLIAGIMQLISGIIGLGRLARFVPMPVISGFTAGIGFIILVSQLPRAFGLEPPQESHIISVFNDMVRYFQEINGMCLFLVVLTIFIIRGLPKLFPRISPILPAVVIASLVAYFANMSVPLIGEIPNKLPSPNLPQWDNNLSFNEIALDSFVIFLLASLETLLSTSAIDKLIGSKKHDSNQELIGQGLGNIAVSLFNGMPVTSVIARSATNVREGAKTRRASIIHALIILLAISTLAPAISKIPIAVLAGVLFNVAYSMMNLQELKDLWVNSRSDALIYLITFFVIISVDLLAGVKAGIIAACAIVLYKASRNNLHITNAKQDQMIRLTLTGPLTFLSTMSVSKLEEEIHLAKPGQTVSLDLTHITNLDSTGASAIMDLYTACTEKNIKFYIVGLPKRFESILKMCGNPASIEEMFLISEHELRKKDAASAADSSYGKLVHGIQRFYLERKENDRRLYQHISHTQNPHTLFITCSDSRMVPSLLTSADPGELFTVRNVGNAIPAYSANIDCSEAAAIEFSLSSLDITDIVICGHANCGAMKACLKFDEMQLSAPLKAWIKGIKSQLSIKENMTLDQVAQMNVLHQMENLKTYPIVKAKLAKKTISIHAWFFDFHQNIMHEWNEKRGKFIPLVSTKE